MSRIEQNLEKLYIKHRIVVWYDPEQAFAEEYASLKLPQVSKIELDGNEFGVKYQVLMAEPEQQFLLYIPYAKPVDEENWLLDIELSEKLFHTNREALLLDELGFPLHYQSWINKNLTFFNSKERMNKFRKLAVKSDTVETLNLKLIQVITNAAQHDLDVLLRQYVFAMHEGNEVELYKDLEKYDLASCFWQAVEAKYGIGNESHNIYDFLLKLFQSASKLTNTKESQLATSKVVLSNWKDLQSFGTTFIWLSKKIASDLKIKEKLNEIVLEDLLEEDLYSYIDQYIIRDLVDKVSHRVYNIADVDHIIKQRENLYWYKQYKNYYKAIHSAILLIQTIECTVVQSFNSLESGFSTYTSAYYKIDQYYRQFISLVRQVEVNQELKPLFIEVEKLYSNNWLPKLSFQWQQVIELSDRWYLGDKSLFRFYNQQVKAKYVDQKKKVFVIISDALRYEIGEELCRVINQQDRLESKLDYSVTGLPSYTQLGMAAMLPHQIVSLGETDDVYIDGLSTQGTIARGKVLQEIGKIRATAIQAEALMGYKTKSDEERELSQNYDVVYVYHNTIDKTGDDKTSEERVFDEVNSEIDYLVTLVRKICNYYSSQVLITADHGFIYQHTELHDSEFADAQLGGGIVKNNRRFVIGKNLEHNDLVQKFSAQNLNIDSTSEVLIAKGITRLRRQGSGSRFVHGGASLQEVVVPVLQVSRRRDNETSKVEVDIIKASTRITTNIQPIRFYQTEPITNNRLGRRIKAYFAVGKGEQKEVISEIFYHTFDSDAPRAENREVSYNFKLATTLQKSTDVYLYLDEEIDSSTTWSNYAEFKFSLILGMMNDFDDFDF